MPFKKLFRFICVSIFTLCLPLTSKGQRVQATFHITDVANVPLGYAAMQVNALTDSATEHFELKADSLGAAVLMLKQGNQYVVRASALGYKPVSKNITINGPHPFFSLVANRESKSLGDVQIVAKRPILRQEDDKTIVDPTELAASSTNAYDIMEKIPGLYVDQDGNIYITSTTPATIYINGREQKMSNADVAAMLKSLPPNSIDRIEILRTPSSKYDASSSGGIVNVILKKGVKIGMTGNTNAGANQGTYGNQFAGVMISNNNGVFNTSLTLQASQRETGERLKTDRIFSPDSLLSQNAYTRYPGHTYFAYYNIGYIPNPKWDLTYDGRVSANNNESYSSSPAIIKQISTGSESVNYTSDLNNDAKNVNITQGLSTKYKPDTLGSEWTTDLSLNYVPTTSTQYYKTTYTLPLNAAYDGNGDINTHLTFLSARTDATKKMPNKVSVEGGLKLTSVNFDNSTHYTITYNGKQVNDTRRTNAYNYNEHIFAAYVQASKDFNGVLIKAGTRLENTNMNGNQTVPADTSFKVNRTDLFPYLYISRKVMSIEKFELRAYLIYRRTISRPSYDYLNPYPKYVDQYVTEMGNPSLRPQFSNNYEANVSVDERPLFAFGYNEMTDIFSQVIYQADSSHRQSLKTYDNLGTNKELYLRGLGGIPPGHTYFFIIGAQYNHNVYSGQYEGAPLNYTHGSWNIFTYQTLKLGKLTQFVVSGFVRFKSQVQFYELSNFGALNLSLNRQFLKKKLKVTLSATDLFMTNNNQFTIDQGSIHATGLRKSDTRRFGLNASYNFGVRKKEEHNFLNDESPEHGDK